MCVTIISIMAYLINVIDKYLFSFNRKYAANAQFSECELTFYNQ